MNTATMCSSRQGLPPNSRFNCWSRRSFRSTRKPSRATRFPIYHRRMFRQPFRTARAGCGSARTKESRGSTAPSSNHRPSRDLHSSCWRARMCARSPRIGTERFGLRLREACAESRRAAMIADQHSTFTIPGRFSSIQATPFGSPERMVFPGSTGEPSFPSHIRGNCLPMMSERLPRTRAAAFGLRLQTEFRF